MKKIKLHIMLVIFSILACLLIVFFANFHYHKNPDPIIVGTYELDEIPNEILNGIDDSLLFLYDNGEVKKVNIINDKLLFEDEFKNVSMISAEYDGYYILDNSGNFRYVSDKEDHIDSAFAEAVNDMCKKIDILKICSFGDNSVVLFEDGTVMSDINHWNDEISEIEEFDFVIFDDFKAQHVFIDDNLLVLAVDKEDNSLIHYHTMLFGDSDVYLKTGNISLESKAVSFANTSFSNVVLCDNGHVYNLDPMNDLYNQVDAKAYLDENYSDVISMSYGKMAFLSLTDDNKLYHT